MQHELGSEVNIMKGHGFFSGSLGTVIESTAFECTVELVVPLLMHGMKFPVIVGEHTDFTLVHGGEYLIQARSDKPVRFHPDEHFPQEEDLR